MFGWRVLSKCSIARRESSGRSSPGRISLTKCIFGNEVFGLDLKMPGKQANSFTRFYIYLYRSTAHMVLSFWDPFPYIYFQTECITICYSFLYLYIGAFFTGRMKRVQLVDQMKSYKPKWHWAICMFRANLWAKNGTLRSYRTRCGRDPRPCNKNGDYCRLLLLWMLRPIVTWCINAMPLHYDQHFMIQKWLFLLHWFSDFSATKKKGLATTTEFHIEYKWKKWAQNVSGNSTGLKQ